MPVAIAGAAISAGIGVATGVAVSTAITTAIVSVAANFALGAITSALSPKPKAPQAPNFARQLQDNILTIRQAAAPRKIVFGRTRVGGTYTFMHTTGSNNNVLHTVVTVTGHAVRGFDALYLDDEVVPLDSNGNATGKYAGKVKCIYGLGTTAGDADFHSALTAAVGSDMWGEDHLQAGCAKAYIAFTYDDDLFSGGLPNPSFVCSGYAGVQDPRVGSSPVTEAWTDNAALCIAQYLRDSARGLGYASADIDETALIAAANDCDEMVERVAVDVTFTAATTDIITVADADAHLRTGTRLQVASDDTLPSGLSASTNYFWIALTTTTGKLATSLANARAGTAIDITSTGSGTHTITVNAEPRYTCNGWIDTSEDPGDVLPRLLASMAGTKTESGGKVVLLSGVWRSASNPIVEADRDGPVQSRHRRSRRDVFNGVKGIFVNPDDNFQPTDFPVVAPSAYLTEDNNERIWRDAELKFTDSPSMAQRIARIELEKNRRQQAVTVPLTLAGMKHRAGDNVPYTNEKRGWDAKTFTVDAWSLEPRDLGGQNPHFGTVVNLSEIDANVFAWTPGTDEATMTASPSTTLPDAFNATEPTDLALTSGTAVLDVRLDGTVFSRIKATWTAPADAQVVSGGTIEVQYKKTSSSTWLAGITVAGDQTEAYILDVEDGVSYDVRIRARRGSGARSDWVTETEHTVVGKTAPPSNVASLSAQQNGNTVTFSWPQVTDKDLAGYEIRYMTAPFMWANATSLTKTTRGTRITSAAVPPSPTDTDGNQIPWVFGIKAVDTSENESTTAATRQLTVINAFDIIKTEEQWPLWSGSAGKAWYISVVGVGPTPDLTILDQAGWSDFGGTPESPASGFSCAWSPDGAYLAIGHGSSPNLTVFDTSDWSEVSGIPSIPAQGNGVAWSPDGAYLAVAVNSSPGLVVLDVSDWSVVGGTATFSSCEDVAWSPDGGHLAVGSASGGTPVVSVFDTSDWSDVGATFPDGSCLSVDFSPDGSYLAAGEFVSPYLAVFDTSDWSGVDVPAPPSRGNGVEWSPDSDYLAVAVQGEPGVTVIGVADWEIIDTVESLSGTGSDVSWSPDGAYLAVARLGSPGLSVIDSSNWSVVTGTPTLPWARYACAFASADAALSDYIRNPLTGTLHVRDRTAASGDKSRLTAYPQDPVPNPIYTAPEIDISQDGTVRIWADITATLESEQTGQADATFEADWRTEAGEYDGFQAVDVAEVTARYVKGRVSQDATDGAAFLERMAITVDSEERVEVHHITVAAGGTVITFDEPFFTEPGVDIANKSASALIPGYENLSETSVKVHLYNTSGSSVGGPAKVTITGV